MPGAISFFAVWIAAANLLRRFIPAVAAANEKNLSRRGLAPVIDCAHLD
jgi:hypothetical protein